MYVAELSVITGQNLNIRCIIFINSGGRKMSLLKVLYYLSWEFQQKPQRGTRLLRADQRETREDNNQIIREK